MTRKTDSPEMRLSSGSLEDDLQEVADHVGDGTAVVLIEGGGSSPNTSDVSVIDDQVVVELSRVASRKRSRFRGLPKERVSSVVREAASAADAALDSAVRRGGSLPSPVFAKLFEILEAVRARAELDNLSQRQFLAQLDVAVGVAEAMLAGNSAVLEQVEDLLTDPGFVSDKVDAVNLARELAISNKLRNESFTTSDLKSWGLSRQRLHQLRSENRLFAVKIPQERGLLYPKWQLDKKTKRGMPGLDSAVLEAKRLEIDPISFHQIMTNPDAGDGMEPRSFLADGDTERVLAILRANSL